MKLSDFLHKDRIKILKPNSSKEMILNELIDFTSETYDFSDLEFIRGQIFHREKLMSTGIGLGLAIPHIRTDQVTNPVITIGIANEGIADYETIDDKPVKIVFLIFVGKEQHQIHVKLLSKIVTELKDPEFVEKLSSAKTSNEVMEMLES